MDASPDRLKQLGAFGIIGDLFPVIFSRKSIFARIVLLLNVPFCILTIYNFPLFMAIRHDKYGWAAVIATAIVYYIVAVIIYLISVSAITYAVACVYASKDATFGKVMSFFPIVWIRLTITFFWVLLIFVVYASVVIGIIFLCTSLPRVAGIILLALLLIACIIGLVYLTILTQLGLVVSVLDETYGRKALSKSKALLKGKLWTALRFFLISSVWYGLLVYFIRKLAYTGALDILAVKIICGIIVCLVYAFLNLLYLTAFTVIYLVCKSHHQELNMVAIRDRLENRRDAKHAQFQLSQV